MLLRRWYESVLDNILNWYDPQSVEQLSALEVEKEGMSIRRRPSEIARDVVAALRSEGKGAREILTLLKLIFDLIAVVGDSVEKILEAIRKTRG